MQDSPNDFNNVPITQNAFVKLIGTVTDINLLDDTFNDIEVTVSHPVSGAQTKFRFPPNMLVVGS